MQQGLKSGHFANGIFVEQFFKAHFETWKIIALQANEQAAVFTGSRHTDIGLTRLLRPTMMKILHAADDAVVKPADGLDLAINARRQPCSELAMARLDAIKVDGLFTQSVTAQRSQLIKPSHTLGFIKLCKQPLRLKLILPGASGTFFSGVELFLTLLQTAFGLFTFGFHLDRKSVVNE